MSDIIQSTIILGGVSLSSTVAVGGDLREVDIDTLAELNAIVTDATLIDTSDSRLSDARTPVAHAHVIADVSDAAAVAASGDYDDLLNKPALPPVVRLFVARTGKTGGTSSDIDGLTTTGTGADLATGDVFLARTGAGGSAQLWYVRGGTDAEDAPGGLVRPDDYAPSTNETILELIL